MLVKKTQNLQSDGFFFLLTADLWPWLFPCHFKQSQNTAERADNPNSQYQNKFCAENFACYCWKTWFSLTRSFPFSTCRGSDRLRWLSCSLKLVTVLWGWMWENQTLYVGWVHLWAIQCNPAQATSTSLHAPVEVSPRKSGLFLSSHRFGVNNGHKLN